MTILTDPESQLHTLMNAAMEIHKMVLEMTFLGQLIQLLLEGEMN